MGMVMVWIGKLGGGILGFVLGGGPVGAAIGAAIGHQFDRGASRTDGPRSPASPAERRRLFFVATFRALGQVAKADGRVSEDEIATARMLMAEMRLGPDDVRRAIALFTEGKQPGFPVEEDAAALRAAAQGYPELLRTFLEIQVDFALAHGGPTPPQRAVLERLTAAAGVDQASFARLEALLRARRNFRGRPGAGGQPRADALAAAYRVLGVDATASDKAVKDAYRRLVNEHHPDKQAARGLPESMREVAKERTREILEAYELVRARRRLR
jgi:DnaJ like chaperone protein